MNDYTEWQFTEWNQGEKILQHVCKTHPVSSKPILSECMYFLGNWHCIQCHATAPIEIQDVALLSGILCKDLQSFMSRSTKHAFSNVLYFIALIEQELKQNQQEIAKLRRILNET